MKTKIAVLAMATLLSASQLSAREIPTALPLPVEEAYLLRVKESSAEGKARYQLIVTSSASNPCFESERVIKRVVSQNEAQTHYELLGYEPTRRFCTQEYNPVTFQYVIDDFSWPEGALLPEFLINGIRIETIKEKR